jgi:hypothetical protein
VRPPLVSCGTFPSFACMLHCPLFSTRCLSLILAHPSVLSVLVIVGGLWATHLVSRVVAREAEQLIRRDPVPALQKHATPVHFEHAPFHHRVHVAPHRAHPDAHAVRVAGRRLRLACDRRDAAGIRTLRPHLCCGMSVHCVCCSASSWTIWGGGHRFVKGCQDTVCCCTSSWTYGAWCLIVGLLSLVEL